jgi:hypothetical protein
MEEYKHIDMTTEASYPLELDFYYPRLKLAFEYQVSMEIAIFLSPKGEQHYHNIGKFINRAKDMTTHADLTKSAICKQKGKLKGCL